ncbi:LacI family transcriptional regulator [Lentilactobacillus curieae]|uniref:LacI family transcriptional regulator n=1 Tax=Lentilactobacillus curieae TaxID=1138822 RepID=A0A1S6QHE1_9LACO|nr:LacI family DNA-binding transcriptional regulator [Lentilactobacillus curieae]AQW21009.1 LacI family transcriptional regulator [Lentilactobacillus curieae]
MVAKLQDVAKLAGVSVTTVSRVINNYGSLSDKTIGKVHDAMRELNYQPNALARAMQGKSSQFVGLIFPNLTNPFFAELVNALERQLFKKGYKVIIASSAENEQIEHEYLGMLMANQVEGIISSSHNLGIEEYQRISAPIVAFDRYLSDNIPIVSADNYAGGRMAADYMVKNQAKNVAVIVDEDTSSSPTLNRLQGSVDVFTENHIDYLPVDLNKTKLADVFPGDFDGVVASNDMVAIEIANQVRLTDKKPFTDFLITGYDGSQLVRSMVPELPTVIQPIDEIATRLIDTLFAIEENPGKVEPGPALPVKFYE